MFTKPFVSLGALALAAVATAKPIPLFKDLFSKRGDSHGDSHSFNNYGGYGSMSHFDDFYGSHDFSGVSQHLVKTKEVVCHTEKIEIVQQHLAVIREYYKKIISEQICEVEVQTIVHQQFVSGCEEFSSDLRRHSGRDVSYDHHISSQIVDIHDHNNECSTNDLGWKGYQVGSNAISYSGDNWNGDYSPSDVDSLYGYCQQSYGYSSPHYASSWSSGYEAPSYGYYGGSGYGYGYESPSYDYTYIAPPYGYSYEQPSHTSIESGSVTEEVPSSEHTDVSYGSDSSHGYGYGSGYDSSYGSGYSGHGSEYGSGYGSSYGSGYGSGYGSSYGSSHGSSGEVSCATCGDVSSGGVFTVPSGGSVPTGLAGIDPAAATGTDPAVSALPTDLSGIPAGTDPAVSAPAATDLGLPAAAGTDPAVSAPAATGTDPAVSAPAGTPAPIAPPPAPASSGPAAAPAAAPPATPPAAASAAGSAAAAPSGSAR